MPNFLGLFRGDDITKPVEMFLQLIEVTAEKEGWEDHAKVEAFLDLVPEEASTNGGSPSVIWKQNIFADRSQEMDGEISWTELKGSLLHTFGSKDRYSDQDKLIVFQSISRHDDEDIHTFFLRVWCFMSLMNHNEILPTWHDMQLVDESWTKLLFLNGLKQEEYDKISSFSELKPEIWCHFITL